MTDPMGVDAAQRRLLEALVAAHHQGARGLGPAGDPLLALSLGLEFARTDAEDGQDCLLSPILVAMQELIGAVRADLVGTEPRPETVLSGASRT